VAGRPLRSSSTGEPRWARESPARVPRESRRAPQSPATAHCGTIRIARIGQVPARETKPKSPRRHRQILVGESVRILRKELSVAIVKAGGDDVPLRAQGAQDFARIVGIGECERRGAVVGDDLTERGEMSNRRLPEGEELVSEECGADEQQYRAAGQQNDRHQTAA